MKYWVTIFTMLGMSFAMICLEGPTPNAPPGTGFRFSLPTADMILPIIGILFVSLYVGAIFSIIASGFRK